MTEDPEGEWGDAWIYEDKVIYVQKKFVAIPKASTPGGDISKFNKTLMTMTATTYDDMRPGCWDPKERKKDFELNWVDGSLPFPTFPRFCGQTFYEADDKELALACVQAYNDWMVEEWCDPAIGVNIPLCIMPLWDVELAATEIKRNAERGVRAVCFSELPTRLNLPSIHTGYWDPMFDAASETGTTVCMHVGSSSSDPASSADAPAGVGGMVVFNNSMASLGDYLFSGKMAQFPKLKIVYSEGQIGWIPYALERADTVWEQHDAWIHAKRLCPEPPSTYYYGRVFGCFTWDQHGVNSLAEVGEDNICFETDYPHTDTTWPNSKEYCEKILAGVDDDTAYKILRGNAIRMLELDRVLSARPTSPMRVTVAAVITASLLALGIGPPAGAEDAAPIGYSPSADGAKVDLLPLDVPRGVRRHLATGGDVPLQGPGGHRCGGRPRGPRQVGSMSRPTASSRRPTTARIPRPRSVGGWAAARARHHRFGTRARTTTTARPASVSAMESRGAPTPPPAPSSRHVVGYVPAPRCHRHRGVGRCAVLRERRRRAVG